jgi:hypothetical protein
LSSNTIDEQRTIEGLGLNPDRLTMINDYAAVRGVGTIQAIRELLNEGLLSLLLAREAAKEAVE